MYPENHGIIFKSFTNPVTKEKYRLGDSTAVRNSEWYLGEAFWETAERNGINTASYFWPGSEVKLDYRRPDFYEKYEHNRPYKERIDGVVDWLTMPNDVRPHFITLYFHDTDSYGHKYGPNRLEINNSIFNGGADFALTSTIGNVTLSNNIFENGSTIYEYSNPKYTGKVIIESSNKGPSGYIKLSKSKWTNN